VTDVPGPLQSLMSCSGSVANNAVTNTAT